MPAVYLREQAGFQYFTFKVCGVQYFAFNTSCSMPVAFKESTIPLSSCLILKSPNGLKVEQPSSLLFQLKFHIYRQMVAVATEIFASHSSVRYRFAVFIFV